MYGFDKARKVLRNLKAIYISHLHADHHLGLINLILEREKSFAELKEEPRKLFILAPARIANYLSVYHRNFQPILTDLEHIRNEYLLRTNLPGQLIQFNPDQIELSLDQEKMLEMLEYVHMKSIKTCLVFHCPSAFAGM